MKNRVFILTEGGKNTGFGHITRCSSLYENLKDKNIETYFIINLRASPPSNSTNYILYIYNNLLFKCIKNDLIDR